MRGCLKNQSRLAGGTVALMLQASVQAQPSCQMGWLPGPGLPGTDGFIEGLGIWDSDGPGAGAALLAIGGTFTVAGNVTSRSVVLYDPLTKEWSSLQGGLTDGKGQPPWARAFTTADDGTLVVGGNFWNTETGTPVNHIARWTGSSWTALGSGMDGGVRALITMPNGDIVAGGSFETAGGITAKHVARWDGIKWSKMANGFSDGALTFALMPNGDLIAGGWFLQGSGQTLNRIARWDGSGWNPMASGFTGLGGHVYSVVVTSAGQLIAAGGFFPNGVASWNGSTWDPMPKYYGGSSISGVTILESPANKLLIAYASEVREWTGTSWKTISPPNHSGDVAVYAPNGDLFVGGATMAGSSPAGGLVRFDGVAWHPLSAGTDKQILDLEVGAGGEVFACGEFSVIQGVPAARIAKWDGAAWSPLGTGIVGTQAAAMAVLPSGDLVVGGSFSTAGGVSTSYIARWDGGTWHGYNAGLDGQVDALAVTTNGHLIVGGSFDMAGGGPSPHIAGYDGASWYPLGSGTDGPVHALLALPNGDLIAAGNFDIAGGKTVDNIARWDGSQWFWMSGGGLTTPTSPFTAGVSALELLPGGGILVGGYFKTAGPLTVDGLALHENGQWKLIGQGLIQAEAFAQLPNGEVLASGLFTGNYSGIGLARWDGIVWTPIENAFSARPSAIAAPSEDNIFVGGSFTSRAGEVTPYFARYTCVASCEADCNGDGELDFFDYLCFQNAFVTAQPSADCNKDGVLDTLDFLCFQSAFALGCP